jgi:elongation factor G
LSALVFKIVTDPYVGRLAYFRVYSGVISQGQMVTNSTKGKRERIGRLIRMHADRREDITEVRAGDIAAALGFKDTFTGDTLCDNKQIVLENITFPEPVISIAIEPKSTADQEKMGEALRKLSEEDPTFRVRSDETTGQTIIPVWASYISTLSLTVCCASFTSRPMWAAPRVAYRESITRSGA